MAPHIYEKKCVIVSDDGWRGHQALPSGERRWAAAGTGWGTTDCSHHTKHPPIKTTRGVTWPTTLSFLLFLLWHGKENTTAPAIKLAQYVWPVCHPRLEMVTLKSVWDNKLTGCLFCTCEISPTPLAAWTGDVRQDGSTLWPCLNVATETETHQTRKCLSNRLLSNFDESVNCSFSS